MKVKRRVKLPSGSHGKKVRLPICPDISKCLTIIIIARLRDVSDQHSWRPPRYTSTY